MGACPLVRRSLGEAGWQALLPQSIGPPCPAGNGPKPEEAQRSRRALRETSRGTGGRHASADGKHGTGRAGRYGRPGGCGRCGRRGQSGRGEAGSKAVGSSLSSGASHAVKALAEPAFILEGGRLRGDLSVQKAACHGDQRQRRVGGDLRVRGRPGGGGRCGRSGRCGRCGRSGRCGRCGRPGRPRRSLFLLSTSSTSSTWSSAPALLRASPRPRQGNNQPRLSPPACRQSRLVGKPGFARPSCLRQLQHIQGKAPDIPVAAAGKLLHDPPPASPAPPHATACTRWPAPARRACSAQADAPFPKARPHALAGTTRLPQPDRPADGRLQRTGQSPPHCRAPKPCFATARRFARNPRRPDRPSATPPSRGAGSWLVLTPPPPPTPRAGPPSPGGPSARWRSGGRTSLSGEV